MGIRIQTGCTLQNPSDIIPAAECGFDYLEFMGKYLVSLSQNELMSLQKKVKDFSVRVLGMNLSLIHILYGFMLQIRKNIVGGTGFE